MEDKSLAPEAELAEPERDSARFVALFLLGFVLFSPLLLRVFEVPGASVFGIPLLFVYLFVTWALLIALAAWLTRRLGRGPEPSADGGH